MQLWKKQNISEFKSLWKRSKIILIEKHFKPTCSRITSTILSAKIQKSTIRELGNVELFELCDTIPKVQFSHWLPYWNQGIVYCTCGQCMIDSESRRKLNKLRLDALSIPNYVIKKKDLIMVLNMARPKNKKSTTWAGMRGRDAVRKLTLKVNILQVVTIHFSEIQFIVNHNSQSDGQNKSAKSGTNLRKKTILINSLRRKREDTKDNGILLWTKQAKMGLWNFDLIFEPLSLWTIVYTTNQGNKLKSLSIQNNTVDGIPLQAHRGGTSLNGIGNELIRFFELIFFLLQLVSFTVDSDPLSSHVIFLMRLAHVWLKVSSVRISLPPHVIHDVMCLSVRLLSLRVCLFLVSPPLLPFLFHGLLVLCPAHHLQCRHRRGWKPLHSRTMRSIAPWRYTILSQIRLQSIKNLGFCFLFEGAPKMLTTSIDTLCLWKIPRCGLSRWLTTPWTVFAILNIVYLPISYTCYRAHPRKPPTGWLCRVVRHSRRACCWPFDADVVGVEMPPSVLTQILLFSNSTRCWCPLHSRAISTGCLCRFGPTRVNK